MSMKRNIYSARDIVLIYHQPPHKLTTNCSEPGKIKTNKNTVTNKRAQLVDFK